MIDPAIRQEIRYRHGLGESERSIAKTLRLSRNTVHAYLADRTRGLVKNSPASARPLLATTPEYKTLRLFSAKRLSSKTCGNSYAFLP